MRLLRTLTELTVLAAFFGCVLTAVILMEASFL